MLRFLAPCCLLLTLLGAVGCAITPEQEVKLGLEARGEFEKEFGGLYPDPQVQQYVQEIGMKMAQQTGRPDLPWEFRVVNAEQINAFALPGGFIYLTRGMISNLENEAQLAAVLSHEAAHVAHRHSAEQLERAQVIQGGALLAGAVSGSSVAGSAARVAGQLAMLQYSREQERDADLTGLKYMVGTGYDPQATVEVMSKLEQLGTGGSIAFLSSHPSPEDRQQYLARQVRRDYGRIISVGQRGEDRFNQIVRRSVGPPIVPKER